MLLALLSSCVITMCNHLALVRDRERRHTMNNPLCNRLSLRGGSDRGADNIIKNPVLASHRKLADKAFKRRHFSVAYPSWFRSSN